MIYVDNRYMELIADETNVSEEDERISDIEAEAARLYIRANAAEAALSRPLKRESDLAIRCYRAESELARRYACAANEPNLRSLVKLG
jgi:hypothetical protein